MKKNTFLGIGTLILSDEIVLAYVNTILDLIKEPSKVTSEDNKNICETLAYLRDNYEGQESVRVLLSNAVSLSVAMGFILPDVADATGDKVDMSTGIGDLSLSLLGIKTILV